MRGGTWSSRERSADSGTRLPGRGRVARVSDSAPLCLSVPSAMEPSTWVCRASWAMEAAGMSSAQGGVCGAWLWHRGAWPAWGGAHSRPATARNQPELGSLHNSIHLYAKSPLPGGEHPALSPSSPQTWGTQCFWDLACPSRALGLVRSPPLLAEGHHGWTGQL